MSEKNTKKPRRAVAMRDQYDFAGAKRGRFPDLAGAHVVALAPDVWEHFGSEAAVISALRGLVETAQFVKPRKKKARRAA